MAWEAFERVGIHAVAGLLAAALTAPAAAASGFELSMNNGRVTIRAQDARITDILAEWGRVGNTAIIDADELVDQTVTIELVDVPEAKAMAELGDIYVNDAFSAAHRAHVTTEALAHLLPAYAGRTMQAELEALEGTPPERGPDSQDFGYLVDPDGVLLEFNGNAETADLFYGHLHFWHEAPWCAVNWYIEHLGAEGMLRDPCEVEIGPVSYPTFVPAGQLRQPIGVVRLANAGLAWYTRQCRDGRCGPDGDQPLVPSRGQVMDHVGFTYPELDLVIAHLEAAGVPILDGPYPFGAGRAGLIEDLDGLALELIEVG